MKYDPRKKDVYELDEDKLAKVINKFFSTWLMAILNKSIYS